MYFSHFGWPLIDFIFFTINNCDGSYGGSFSSGCLKGNTKALVDTFAMEILQGEILNCQEIIDDPAAADDREYVQKIIRITTRQKQKIK